MFLGFSQNCEMKARSKSKNKKNKYIIHHPGFEFGCLQGEGKIQLALQAVPTLSAARRKDASFKQGLI